MSSGTPDRPHRTKSATGVTGRSRGPRPCGRPGGPRGCGGRALPERGPETRAGDACQGARAEGQASRSSQEGPEVLTEEARLSGGAGGTSPHPEQLHWGTQPRSARLGPAVTRHGTRLGQRSTGGGPAGDGAAPSLPDSSFLPKTVVSRSLQLAGTSMPSRILTGRWGYGDKAHYHLPSSFPVAGQLSSLSGSLADSSLSPRRGL